MNKEVSFDPIFDAQQAFRVLLDAFSHPGTLYSFENYELSHPKELATSNAIIALSLFDNNISLDFEVVDSYIAILYLYIIIRLQKTCYLLIQNL